MTEQRSLRSERDGREYVLEIAAVPDSIRECPPTITSRVLLLDAARRELRARVLFRGTGGPTCVRRSLAPVTAGGNSGRNSGDVLLDALVFGVRFAIDVTVYDGELRREFEQYLRRADAYRTPRRPAGGYLGEAGMVDAARIDYERRLAAIARDNDVTTLAVAYVDSLRPCYEWEGFHDCPEREAQFADSWRAAHPDGPLSAYLPLLAAHRWLCAAEAFDRERRPQDAARSRAAYTDRLAVARSSNVLLIRTAAEYLERRTTCHATAAAA